MRLSHLRGPEGVLDLHHVRLRLGVECIGLGLVVSSPAELMLFCMCPSLLAPLRLASWPKRRLRALKTCCQKKRHLDSSFCCVMTTALAISSINFQFQQAGRFHLRSYFLLDAWMACLAMQVGNSLESNFNMAFMQHRSNVLEFRQALPDQKKHAP